MNVEQILSRQELDKLAKMANRLAKLPETETNDAQLRTTVSILLRYILAHKDEIEKTKEGVT